MKRLLAAAILVGLPGAAFADITPGRYTVMFDPTPARGVWRVDNATGSVSRCESSTLTADIVCTPWSEGAPDQALYRFDAAAQKLVPANDAARRRDAGH